MMLKLFATALAAFLCTNSFAEPIQNVAALVGKTQAQVVTEMKSAPECKKVKFGTSCNYADRKVEIVFINGKADWITVNDLAQVPFSDDALARLGLAQHQPSFKSPMVIRWNGVQGVREVSIFKGSPGVDYAYIKAFTP